MRIKCLPSKNGTFNRSLEQILSRLPIQWILKLHGPQKEHVKVQIARPLFCFVWFFFFVLFFMKFCIFFFYLFKEELFLYPENIQPTNKCTKQKLENKYNITFTSIYRLVNLGYISSNTCVPTLRPLHRGSVKCGSVLNWLSETLNVISVERIRSNTPVSDKPS